LTGYPGETISRTVGGSLSTFTFGITNTVHVWRESLGPASSWVTPKTIDLGLVAPGNTSPEVSFEIKIPKETRPGSYSFQMIAKCETFPSEKPCEEPSWVYDYNIEVKADEETWEEIMIECQSATAEQNFDDAMYYCEMGYKIKPDNYVSLVSLAVVHIAIENYDIALNYLDDALDYAPKEEKAKVQSFIDVITAESATASTATISIPAWIKNNAGWWANGQIDDSSFVQGIEFLIQEGIITIPPTVPTGSGSGEIPAWVKNNAEWWASDQIDDDTFVQGIQFLVEQGIIQV